MFHYCPWYISDKYYSLNRFKKFLEIYRQGQNCLAFVSKHGIPRIFTTSFTGSAVVTYSTKSFRLKNMDRLDSSLLTLLKGSSNQVVVEIFEGVSDPTDGKGGSKLKGNLIGSQFSRNMEELMV